MVSFICPAGPSYCNPEHKLSFDVNMSVSAYKEGRKVTRMTMCRAEHKTPQGAGQRRKPKEKEKQPELGQKRKNTDVQARQSKKSCSRDGG